MKQDSALCSPPNVKWFSPEQWNYLQERYQISPRELQVAKLVCCKELENKEIAKELNIAPDTVHVHLRSIYRKIRVRDKIPMLLRFIEDIENLKQSANL